MAFANTAIRETANVSITDVESTADADVGPHNVPHGLGHVPLEISLLPLQVESYTSAWIVSGVTATDVELTAANAVGSGVAGDQVRVIAHSDPLRSR